MMPNRYFTRTAVLLFSFVSIAVADNSVQAPLHLLVKPVGQTDVTPEERQDSRITALEAKLVQQASEISNLKSQLATTTDTANKAQLGMGFLNVGIDTQIKGVKADIASTKADVASANQAIADSNAAQAQLAEKFSHHTHPYNTLEVHVHSDGDFKDVKYKVDNTAPPNQ